MIRQLSFLFLLLIIICLKPIHVEGQSKHLLDIEKLNTFYNFYKNKNIDSTLFYANKILKIAIAKNDSSLIAKTNIRLGFYHRKKTKNLEAFKNYLEALTIFKGLRDSSNIAKTSLYVSNLQNAIGDYQSAEITAVDGLKHIESLKKISYKTGLYNCLAISSKNRNDLFEASYYYDKALQISSDSISTLIILNNQAVVFIKTRFSSKSYF